jgi:uncharacterized protein DUF3352
MPRLRNALYAIEDFLLAAGRVPVAIRRGSQEFWFSLSIHARQRLALVLGMVVAISLVWLVAVPALPCGAPGGDRCAPADDAIHLVPDDALAYLHLNVDPDTEQFEDAAEVASRMPAVTTQAIRLVESRLPGPRGAPPDFGREIEPWFGGEAALAVLPAGAGPGEEVELLEVSDEDAARKFAASIAAGKPRSTTYRDLQVRVDRRGLATAVVGGFLVIGRASGVREVIDADSGAKGSGSLAGDPNASAARDALPDKRLADAYLSEDGIAELVQGRGPLAALAPIVNPDASRGAAVALVANNDGLGVDFRSELDRERAKEHPGFFSALPSFGPTLAGSLPSDSLGYIGIGDPGKALKSLLEQAGAEAPGLADAVGALVERARKLGDVDLEKDLLPSLGGEAALALEPSPDGGAAGNKQGGGNEGAVPGSETPFLEFIAADVDSGRASQALARLQGPITQALNPPRGLPAAVFSQHEVGDVTAYSVRVSGAVELTYAVAGSTLVIATNRAGVEQVVSGEGGLDDVDHFDQATDGFPSELSMLGYLDLGGVIALGEQAGLAEDPAYATFASEIQKLEALGLAVQSSLDELSTHARLIVGEGTGGLGGAEARTSESPTD